VLVLQRRGSTQTMVGLYNMTPEVQKLPRWVVALGNWCRDALTEETPLDDGEIELEPYQTRWLVQSV
jgi:amylosucrase